MATDSDTRAIQDYLFSNPNQMETAQAVWDAWPKLKAELCGGFLEHLRVEVHQRVQEQLPGIASDIATVGLRGRGKPRAFEDRLERMGERSVTDIVKQPGHRENSGVVPGQASVPGIEERQSRNADAVVVSVLPVAGLDVVDGPEEADPPESLDGARSSQFAKKRIPESARRVHRFVPVRRGGFWRRSG